MCSIVLNIMRLAVINPAKSHVPASYERNDHEVMFIVEARLSSNRANFSSVKLLITSRGAVKLLITSRGAADKTVNHRTGEPQALAVRSRWSGGNLKIIVKTKQNKTKNFRADNDGPD